MIIRNAKNTDFKRITEIYEQVEKKHRNAYPDIFKMELDDIDDYLNYVINIDNSLLMVSEINNKVIGFSECYIMEAPDLEILTPRSWLFIKCMAVDEEFKEEKIQQEMLDYLMEFSKEIELDGIELKVYSFNENSEKFYYKNDFIEISKTLSITL